MCLALDSAFAAEVRKPCEGKFEPPDGGGPKPQVGRAGCAFQGACLARLRFAAHVHLAGWNAYATVNN